MKFSQKIVWIVILLHSIFSFSQKKEENIGSEVVNIVKAYSPTISDAFKVKETPTIEAEETPEKEPIQYPIFSVPVASTFTPSKGKAAGLDQVEKTKLYDNYATLGIGNYATINAELFVTKALDRSSYVGGMFRHLSSQGGIKDLILDDKFGTTSLDATYGVKERDYSWNVDLGAKNQAVNWYGLPVKNIAFSENMVNEISSKQSYTSINLGGKIAVKKSFFKDANVLFKHFSDKFKSSENRFFVMPNFDFDVLQQKIKTAFILDYVGSNFEHSLSPTSTQKYSSLITGIKPSILYQKDDLSVEMGASLFYGNYATKDKSSGSVFVYPNVKASYKLMGDLLVAFAGADGNLDQNSYASFVDENPFVSPTLTIAPTDTKYDIYAGLKGKITSAVAFNVKASIVNQDSKALFISNPFDFTLASTQGFANGNSFSVVYDNVQTVSFFAELKADFTKNISFGLNGTFSSYSVDKQAEAWNLPSIKIGSDLGITISEKWFAGATLFFVGERKDLVSVQSLAAVFPPLFDSVPVTLDSYFDVNAKVTYKYNNRLTGFLKGNNLGSQNYTRWANYPVQGIQVMLGANYKFDF